MTRTDIDRPYAAGPASTRRRALRHTPNQPEPESLASPSGMRLDRRVLPQGLMSAEIQEPRVPPRSLTAACIVLATTVAGCTSATAYLTLAPDLRLCACNPLA